MAARKCCSVALMELLSLFCLSSLLLCSLLPPSNAQVSAPRSTPFASPGSGPGTPSPAGSQGPQTRVFNYTVAYASYTRLCHTKNLVAVNGLYPGPTAYVNEGDTVVVTVTNNLPDYNITIHWHGVRQLLTCWADGPAYITQCPVKPGSSYVHKFNIIGQRGTLLWHAHISWQRATVHGAFIIQPKGGAQFPFVAPGTDIPIVLGEWWNVPVENVIQQALATGSVYNISDALTLNGQPGAFYNCSLPDTPIFQVEPNTTYRLRVINAAVNFLLYFGVANHSLTTVEVDAEYTQPLVSDFVMLAPGQTTTLLLNTSQPPGQYIVGASVYSAPLTSFVPFPTIPATGVIQYTGGTNVTSLNTLALPAFPPANDTAFVANYTQSLRGQPPSRGFFYYNVPQKVDEEMLITVGYALLPCSNCSSPFPGYRFASGMSNYTFLLPQTSILQAYYEKISGVYQSNFPNHPLFQYNYTAVNPVDKESVVATKVKVLKFGITVQIVLQDTATLFFESHPIHLHGQNFFIVATGNGTYNPDTDPASFNLVDPPSRNTIAVPSGGWAAIRFQTTNPGVWFLHCHIDLHTVWGMVTAFVVENGVGPSQTLPPPPADYPPC